MPVTAAFDDLIMDADRALYEAKHLGRDTVVSHMGGLGEDAKA